MSCFFFIGLDDDRLYIEQEKGLRNTETFLISKYN